MPKQVTIGKKEILIDKYNNECLKKRKLEKPNIETVIYEGGIGEFIDLLYRDEFITARTTEGWFFSNTKGETWLSEEEAENHGEIKLDKSSAEYSFIKEIIMEYIVKEHGIQKLNTFSVEERVNAVNHTSLELIELENDENIEQFLVECLHIKQVQSVNPFLIFPKEKKKNVRKTLYDFHFQEKKFVLKRKLKNIEYTYFFTPDFGIENLFNFYFNMVRAKAKHDTKLFIISDLTLFFKNESNLDFVESTLRNLCQNIDLLGMRIIVPYSKRSNMLTKAAIEHIRKFNHNLVDHFVQVSSDENKILIKEK
jgi:hypothetical protein